MIVIGPFHGPDVEVFKETSLMERNLNPMKQKVISHADRDDRGKSCGVSGVWLSAKIVNI